jgi:hypothetical protein
VESTSAAAFMLSTSCLNDQDGAYLARRCFEAHPKSDIIHTESAHHEVSLHWTFGCAWGLVELVTLYDC